MKISTLSGHLTSANKKHIKAMIEASIMNGKVGRITYNISLNDGVYTVRTTQNETTIFNRIEAKSYVATFKLS